MQDLLSQDEIDALLHGVDGGDVDTDGEINTTGVKPYDLTLHDRSARGRMPNLDMINERFSRYTRLSLFNLLRRNVEVVVGGIQLLKYGEYVQNLYQPTSINMVKFDPLRGTGLFVFDSRLVFRLVDNYFGGDGKQAKADSKEFTPTELRVVQLVLEQSFNDYSNAWKKVHRLDLEYKGSEMNPSLVNVIAPNDIVIVNSFHLILDGGGGEFQIVYPYSTIEPIKDLLCNGNKPIEEKRNEKWVGALRRDILDASIDFDCNLFEREIALRDVVDLEKGDVIPVEMQDQVVLKANGIPMFKARVGTSDRKVALIVDSIISNR